jgi:hypothetical protein
MDAEQRVRELRKKFITNVVVRDGEFETYEFCDVADVGMDQFNNLLVTDADGFVLMCLSAGNWVSFETSRTPRLESIREDDTDEGQTDDNSTSERQPDLPRDGA